MTHDYEGAKAFYGGVFGYSYDEIGDDSFTYSTGKRAGGDEVVSGLGVMGSEVPAGIPPQWTTYFNVADTDATVARAVELGATIQSQPFDSPFGRMAVIQGPQGELFSVMQSPPPST